MEIQLVQLELLEFINGWLHRTSAGISSYLFVVIANSSALVTFDLGTSLGFEQLR